MSLTLADLRVRSQYINGVLNRVNRQARLSDLIEVIESEGGKVVTLHGPLLVPNRLDWSLDKTFEPGRYVVLRLPEREEAE